MNLTGQTDNGEAIWRWGESCVCKIYGRRTFDSLPIFRWIRRLDGVCFSDIREFGGDTTSELIPFFSKSKRGAMYPEEQ